MPTVATAAFGRAFLLWWVFLVGAILNGSVRQGWLIPRLGEPAAHVVSTLVLAGAIVLVTWLAFRWLKIGSYPAAWCVGAFWFGLTIAFEFLGGHYLFRAPWSRLLAEYDVARGRIWIIVLVATLCAPAGARWLHAMRAGS